jgi:excisionase family DNA binding protein
MFFVSTLEDRPIMAKKSKAPAGKPIKPFTLAYAGAKLGASLPTVYRLIHTGKLRTYKVGVKGRRVSDAAIADCIALLEAEDNKIAPRPCADTAIGGARHARL